MKRIEKVFNEREKNLILVLYEMGKTDSEVAYYMGFSERTFRRLIKSNGLLPTIKRSKDTADMKVEAILYQKAMEGNVTAIFYWLGNRQREKWQSVNRIEHSGTIETKVTKTDEEITDGIIRLFRPDAGQGQAPGGGQENAEVQKGKAVEGD